MNVDGHNSNPSIQFLNICKICKKVFKDKGGLLEHQKLLHSNKNQSISQQVQQLAMNRFNRDIQSRNKSNFQRNFKKERFNSCDTMKIVKVESYATLQKPPASLKPKLQSRMHQQLSKLSSPNKNLNDNDTDTDLDEWKKWEPEKESSMMIITASVAKSTAACYNPPEQTTNNNIKDEEASHQEPKPNPLIITTTGKSNINNSQLIKSGASGSSVVIKTQQTITNKVNPQLLNRIQQSVSGCMIKSSQQQQQSVVSPNKMNPRIPVPKLMSKTKAQFQILKSQAMRPKILPRNSASNALPRNTTNNTLMSPPKLIKQADLPALNEDSIRRAFKNPPQLLRESIVYGTTSRGGGTVAATAKPVSTTRNMNLLSNPTKKSIPTAATRGGGQQQILTSNRGTSQPHSQATRRGGGRQMLPPPRSVVRRESLNSPSGSESDNSEDNDNDSSYSSPPPPKKSKPTTSTNNSSSGGMNILLESLEEVRIYGKDYKCPPMDKLASFLNKKGVRVWICLVCEETEEEISRGPMICCDACEDWYHFSCVGIDDEPPEDEKWFCKRCIFRNLQTKIDEPTNNNNHQKKQTKRGKPTTTKRRGGSGGGRGGRKRK